MYNRKGYFVTDSRQIDPIKNDIMPLFYGVKKQKQTADNGNAGNALFSENHMRFFMFDFNRGTGIVYMLLALFGIVILLFKRRWKLEHSLCLNFFILNTFIFFAFAIAYRYFIVNILLIMPFVVVGFVSLYKTFKKIRLNIAFMICVLLFGGSQIVLGLHNEYTDSRVFEHQVGHWIAKNNNSLKNPDNTGPFTLLVLRFPQIAFWAHADKVRIDDFVSSDKLISPPKGRPFMEGMHFSQATAFSTAVKLIHNGFRARHLIPAINALSGDKIIYPDLIVIQYPKTNHKLIEKLSTISILKKVHNKWDNKVALFRVLS
jgi:hypothetical protein